jgi:hypothetical protein
LGRDPSLHGSGGKDARSAAAPGIPARHDDWYLNLVWIESRKNLLLTHAGTAFPIFVADIRKSDVQPLARWLTRQITDALEDEGIPSDALGMLDSTSVQIAKTASRQVLGFMNETAFRASWEIADSGGLQQKDIHGLNGNLRRDLHNYSGRYATLLVLITGRRR